jgi:hypothetical protein
MAPRGTANSARTTGETSGTSTRDGTAQRATLQTLQARKEELLALQEEQRLLREIDILERGGSVEGASNRSGTKRPPKDLPEYKGESLREHRVWSTTVFVSFRENNLQTDQERTDHVFKALSFELKEKFGRWYPDWLVDPPAWEEIQKRLLDDIETPTYRQPHVFREFEKCR